MPKKFYVVWVGRKRGIFTDWSIAKKQIDHFPQAKYKSFPTRAEAEAAYASGRGGVNKNAAAARGSEKAPLSNKNFDVQIYCDGAAMPNPGKSGSGIAIYRKGILAELWYGLYNPKGTNNTAELNALHQALLAAKKNMDSGTKVQILCDSQYAINCITVWAYDWKRRGWTKKTGEIKNLAIIQDTHALYEKIKMEVVVSHIKAHAGIEGNELADRMTVFAIDRKKSKFSRYEDPPDIARILQFRSG